MDKSSFFFKLDKSCNWILFSHPPKSNFDFVVHIKNNIIVKHVTNLVKIKRICLYENRFGQRDWFIRTCVINLIKAISIWAIWYGQMRMIRRKKCNYSKSNIYWRVVTTTAQPLFTRTFVPAFSCRGIQPKISYPRIQAGTHCMIWFTRL